MLKRLYIDNFRCLSNFELKFTQPTNLFIGRNGSGKSSIILILRLFQSMASEVTWNQIKLSPDDFGFRGTDAPISMNMEVELPNGKYEYSVKLSYPINFFFPKVQEERLLFNGKFCFVRTEADITIYNSTGESHFSLDWHSMALPIIHEKHGENVISTYRNWLKDMILIMPIYENFGTNYEMKNNETLDYTCGNFVLWLSRKLSEKPSLYELIISKLRIFLSDLSEFEIRPIGPNIMNMIFYFRDEEKGTPQYAIPLEKLSNGEKSFLLCTSICAVATKAYSPLCLWDEIDNCVSSMDIDKIVRLLRKTYMNAYSFFGAISHDYDVLEGFNAENTLILTRNNHLQPTLPPHTLKECKEKDIPVDDLKIALNTGALFETFNN